MRPKICFDSIQTFLQGSHGFKSTLVLGFISHYSWARQSTNQAAQHHNLHKAAGKNLTLTVYTDENWFDLSNQGK